MGFTRAELEAHRGEGVPDLVPPDPRLVFVGINPGLWTAAAQAHFAYPGNRFYPALAEAGILPRTLDVTDGLAAEDRAVIERQGIVLTNLVNRATARADELGRDELREGAVRLERNVEAWHPKVVAVVGITAYRQAFDRPKAVTGKQPERIADAELWVVPNPSGLNAHDTIASLAVAYAEPAMAAGVIR